MPHINFFADGRDADVFLDWLNADPEIAFLVPDGPLDPEIVAANRGRPAAGYRQRWKAVRTVSSLKDGHHSLWHVPGRPLPLLAQEGPDTTITDPWAGWTEQRTGPNRRIPYFGPAYPGEIRLELWTRHLPYSPEEKNSLTVVNRQWAGNQDNLLVSDFQWLSGRLRYGPRPKTERWWKRLDAWFGRSAARLTAGRRASFWACPSALTKLKSGMVHYARGFDLSAAIRYAEPGVRSSEMRDLLAPTGVVLDPAWLAWDGRTVRKLAESIHADRAFDCLPILADALEDSGCGQTDILEHLRGPGPHSRGCWVLSLLLERD